MFCLNGRHGLNLSAKTANDNQVIQIDNLIYKYHRTIYTLTLIRIQVLVSYIVMQIQICHVLVNQVGGNPNLLLHIKVQI